LSGRGHRRRCACRRQGHRGGGLCGRRDRGGHSAVVSIHCDSAKRMGWWTWTWTWTYSRVGAVDLCLAGLDGIVGLGDAVVVFCSARHDDCSLLKGEVDRPGTC
jgi:hypothetical protein